MRLTILVSLLLIGCSSVHDTTATRPYMRPDDLPGTWTVTAVGTDRGHLTYEDVNRDHTYVLGIECERDAKSITLLYYDRLPDDLAINVGDQLVVNTTDETEFESFFGGGFWVHQLLLTRP